MEDIEFVLGVISYSKKILNLNKNLIKQNYNENSLTEKNGANIRISPLIEGLIPISELSLEKVKDINDFLKYRYNNIDLGKIVYDDVLRRSGQPTVTVISFKLFYHLLVGLIKSDQCKKIIDISKYCNTSMLINDQF